MKDIVIKAMKRFRIPPHRANFLFLLPPFFVAKADGKISAKEVMAIGWSSLTSGLMLDQERDSNDLNHFLENEVVQLKNTPDLEDIKILTAALNAHLASFKRYTAQRIIEIMYDMCLKVANASGPVFGENISQEESKMIEAIFSRIYDRSE